MTHKKLLLLLALTAFLAGCLQGQSVPAAPAASAAIDIIPSTFPSPTVTATTMPFKARKLPYLIMTDGSDSLKVCWQFDAPADAVLDWGTDENYSIGSVAIPAAQAGDVTCTTLDGLLPGTRYDYRLTSRGAVFPGHFITAPAATSDDLTFWGYGDTQANPAVHDAIAAAILKETGNGKPTFVFDAGDIMEEASEESLQELEFDSRWQNIVRLSSQVPVVNVMGNHDGTQLFIKYYPYPYSKTFDWSFDYGPAHFVVIDLYSGLDENSPRWQWLRNDLATSTKKWKFILLHEPGWSAGPHENNVAVQQIIHPIAARYGVSIVFSGHNHYYAHAEVDGVTYITTGGGGGELNDPEYGWPNIIKKVKAHHYLRIDIRDNNLTLTALSPEGKTLDQFQIDK